MTSVIGPVMAPVDLEILIGADFVFDAKWWEDNGVVGIPIAEFRSLIKREGATVLDLADYATIDPVLTNVVHVFVPAATTETLEETSHARWDMELVASGSGEVVRPAGGIVRIRPEVTT